MSKTEKYTPTERCRVCVRKASASYDVPHSVQDTNVLVVDIAADLLGNGTYAVEVTDKDVRSMRLAQFAIATRSARNSAYYDRKTRRKRNMTLISPTASDARQKPRSGSRNIRTAICRHCRKWKK